MSEVIKGISNEKLLELTNMIAGQPVAFNADADKTTDADIQQAADEAKRYAESRNRGSNHKSTIGLDPSLVASVRSWCKTKGKKLRG